MDLKTQVVITLTLTLITLKLTVDKHGALTFCIISYIY